MKAALIQEFLLSQSNIAKILSLETQYSASGTLLSKKISALKLTKQLQLPVKVYKHHVMVALCLLQSCTKTTRSLSTRNTPHISRTMKK